MVIASIGGVRSLGILLGRGMRRRGGIIRIIRASEGGFFYCVKRKRGEEGERKGKNKDANSYTYRPFRLSIG